MAMFSPKKKLKVGALLGLMFTWGILLKCSSESKHGPETQGVIKTKQLLTNYMKWPQNAKEIPHLRFLKTLWAPHVVQLSVNFWYLGLLVLGANLVLGSMLVGNHWSKVAPKLENSLLIFFSLALASQPFRLGSAFSYLEGLPVLGATTALLQAGCAHLQLVAQLGHLLCTLNAGTPLCSQWADYSLWLNPMLTVKRLCTQRLAAGAVTSEQRSWTLAILLAPAPSQINFAD